MKKNYKPTNSLEVLEKLIKTIKDVERQIHLAELVPKELLEKREHLLLLVKCYGKLIYDINPKFKEKYNNKEEFLLEEFYYKLTDEI